MDLKKEKIKKVIYDYICYFDYDWRCFGNYGKGQ